MNRGGNRIFLGCFSCDPYASASIWNKYGNHGSKYSDRSIWNEYSDFGSEYSDYSPWNQYTENSPVLVDRSGGFYGYFTCSRYREGRVSAKIMDFICENVDEIRDDPQEFYEKYLQ